MIGIVDYGMGNLRSVQKALERLGFAVELVETPTRLLAADRIILPGVGAFGDAMRGLRERGLVEPLRQVVREGRPFLGICLGMQVLMERSEESPDEAGLGLLPGKVVRFRTDLKVPHMGWNLLSPKKNCPLYAGLDGDLYVYFVHSYYVAPAEESVVATTTDYSADFCSSLWTRNLFATQFHPEKSQAIGLKMLENFGSYHAPN